MIEIHDEVFKCERALFHSKEIKVNNSSFEDGESPLKESESIELEGCSFKWKYPLWYCRNVLAKNCHWYEMGRAGVWYTDDITVMDSLIEAPKNFRRCHGLTLKNIDFTQAEETLWHCDKVVMDGVSAKGDYFAMNSHDMQISGLNLEGNYPFDGGANIEIHDSKLISKDAFWNAENITVYDSYISGEYLGWNSKNLTFINCTIESLQGLCYIENLVMKNCKLVNTTLAFEYSSVDAQINGSVDSVLNPSSGSIKADRIGCLIIQKDYVDPGRTRILCDVIDEEKDKPF